MSVFITNLDDFINPSQACINPLVATKSNKAAAALLNKAVTTGAGARIQLVADFSTTDDLLFSTQQQQPVTQEPNLIKSKLGKGAEAIATVSLNDCLAW